MSKPTPIDWSTDVRDRHTFRKPTTSNKGKPPKPTVAPAKPRPFTAKQKMRSFKKNRRDAIKPKTVRLMSDQEVRFWIWAGSDAREDIDEVLPDLSERDLSADIPFEVAAERFGDFADNGSWWLGETQNLIPLYLRFYPWGDVFTMIVERASHDRRECLEVMPVCDDPAEVQRVTPAIHAWLDAREDAEIGYADAAHVLRFFPYPDAAVRHFEFVNRWWVIDDIAELLVQLPAASVAYKVCRKQKMTLTAADAYRLIDRFGYDAVDELVLALDLQIAKHIRSAKTVPAWLDRATKGKKTDFAQWFLAHEGCNAIDGMLAFLPRRGKKRDVCVKLLKQLVDSGHGDTIEQLAANHSDKVRALLATDVLAAATHAIPELPKDRWLPWMVTAAAQTVSRKKVANVLGTGRLDVVTTDNASFRIPEDVLLGYLAMVASHTEDTVEVTGVDRAGIGRMAWGVVERWLQADRRAAGQWCMNVLKSLGGESEAAKLGREARKAGWSGSELTTAIDVLRAMDNRDALTALVRMDNKWKARQLLPEIRKEKGYPDDEDGFLDSIIPTCALSDLHTIDLDFGGRMFTLALTPPSKVLIVDRDSGEVFQKFPPRRKKDDAEKHKAARGIYQLFRKELVAVVEHETKRLEQAMLEARVWTRDAWLDHLSHHPVMGPLACTIVWKTWVKGQLLTFMPTHPDDSCIDASYDEVELGKEIAIAHPVDCSQEDRDRWNELLTDSEIVQPFAQLGRSCYVPGSKASDRHLERLTTKKWSDEELRSGLYSAGFYGAKEKDYKFVTFRRFYGKWTVIVRVAPPVPRWSWPPSGPDHGIKKVTFTATDGSKKRKPPATVYSEVLLALESLLA